MKFPKHIKHRGRPLATIYAKSKHHPLDRVAWTVAGKRMRKGFPGHRQAKRHADALVRGLTEGSRVSALPTSPDH